MTDTKITFRKFTDRALATGLEQTLADNDIDTFVEELAFSFNPTFIDDELNKEFAVKIAPSDFERANELLRQQEVENIKEADPDHYLFKFSNDELRDILLKADEWSEFDYLLARKILQQRGEDVSDEKLESLKQARLQELKQPEQSQGFWVIVGYVAAVFGGVLGIFIGWHLQTHMKTLPNGERVYGYNESDRKHGKIIFYLAISVFVNVFCTRLYRAYQS